jgi:hypothetical protein
MAVAVGRELEVVALPLEPSREQPDAGPRVEPPMDEGDLGGVALDEDGGESGAEAAASITSHG